MCLMQLNKKPHQVSHFLKFKSEENIASIRLRITLLRVFSALQLPGPFFPMYHYTGRQFKWIAYTQVCLIFCDNFPC